MSDWCHRYKLPHREQSGRSGPDLISSPSYPPLALTRSRTVHSTPSSIYNIFSVHAFAYERFELFALMSTVNDPKSCLINPSADKCSAIILASAWYRLQSHQHSPHSTAFNITCASWIPRLMHKQTWEYERYGDKESMRQTAREWDCMLQSLASKSNVKYFLNACSFEQYQIDGAFTANTHTHKHIIRNDNKRKANN